MTDQDQEQRNVWLVHYLEGWWRISHFEAGDAKFVFETPAEAHRFIAVLPRLLSGLDQLNVRHLPRFAMGGRFATGGLVTGPGDDASEGRPALQLVQE